MNRICLLLVGVGSSLAVAAADMVMEIVPLRHRLIDELLPTLRELVVEGGTVTGLNDQLIIRTTPENLADLKQVLAGLDTELRQLRITVRQDIAAHNRLREDQLSARIESGDVSAGVGAPHGGPGATIAYGKGDSRVQYRSLSTHGSEDSANTHFVTTVEGTPAFISAGQSVPLPAQSAVLTPHGAVVHESIDYRDVGAGFYVTPRLAGDRVNLEISPFAERPSRRGGGAIDARGLSTTVSGRLGEWIPLGGAAESSNAAAGGLAYGTRRYGADSYDVWVKVEVVP